jgi:hypothetical protein
MTRIDHAIELLLFGAKDDIASGSVMMGELLGRLLNEIVDSAILFFFSKISSGTAHFATIG